MFVYSFEISFASPLLFVKKCVNDDSINTELSFRTIYPLYTEDISFTFQDTNKMIHFLSHLCVCVCVCVCVCLYVLFVKKCVNDDSINTELSFRTIYPLYTEDISFTFRDTNKTIHFFFHLFVCTFVYL
jgi:hypothetical protein